MEYVKVNNKIGFPFSHSNNHIISKLMARTDDEIKKTSQKHHDQRH